jgi:hypothetical protein
MKIKKWLKNKATNLLLVTSNVEKSMLSQSSDEDLSTSNKEQKLQQSSLMSALLRGEVTQEVESLRWRMYKVIGEAQNYKTTINNIKRDDDNFEDNDDEVFSVTTAKINIEESRNRLKNIIIYNGDEHPLELVLDNLEITSSIIDILGKIRLDSVTGDSKGRIGGVTSSNMNSSVKSHYKMEFTRDFRPKYEIEEFIDKIHIRSFDNSKKIIELCVFKYEDETKPLKRILLSELKKGLKNPIHAQTFNFNKINFVTEKTTGYHDFMIFEYENVKLFQIVEFNQYFIIRYYGEVTKNGEYLFEKYRLEELEEKYANKERKNGDFLMNGTKNEDNDKIT